MESQSPEETAGKLAKELKKLLQENLLKNPVVTGPAMKQARKLRSTIQSFGFLVTTEYILDPDDLTTLEVNITLWKPKENMSPEEQKTYDVWFAKMNGLKID